MFIVIELQKIVDNEISNIVTTHENRREAESHYHSILAAAAISTIPVHTAIILSEKGLPVMFQCYEHETDETD